MGKVSPYHSDGGTVYHIYSQCHLGNNIEKDKLRSGTGGLPLCDNCKKIQSGERPR